MGNTHVSALRDDGRYQDGGYWATPLAWFMDALMRVDVERAAATFCAAVADFRAAGINEWINRDARGVADYVASASMPLAGVRRLRAHLAARSEHLGQALETRLDEDEAWLGAQADRIIRAGSAVGKDGVRIFTPDASGWYRAFWVRDWSYAIEGSPQAFTRQELRDGYRLLAAAQRADGCMPDRVRADGVGIYSPGPDDDQLSAHGSTDQSPFMVIVCHQYWRLHDDLEPFLRTAEALERGLRFVPRNPDNGLVTIADPRRFRPYSFMDCVPLMGDEQFSSVLLWDACRKLAEMFAAAGDDGRAAPWRAEAERVRAGLVGLWDDGAQAFVAASERWPQPSVWGSAFAVYTGITTAAQTAGIARFCADNYDRIVQRGQIRHLLKGAFWGQPQEQYVSRGAGDPQR